MVNTDLRYHCPQLDHMAFLVESNKIEGIEGTSKVQIKAFERFMMCDKLFVEDIELLASELHGGKHCELRTEGWQNVRVGGHIAPKGGPLIKHEFKLLLENVNADNIHPYKVHQWYETLHPFTDGNGRTGRAVWVWQMYRYAYWFNGSFLHTYYYQSLDHIEKRKDNGSRNT